jgi:hypothetical protein
MGQTIAEWYFEQQRTEGRAEGEAKGRNDTLHRALLRLGRQRFGERSAAITATLTALTDVERLDRLTERLLQAARWQDLPDTL